MSVPDIQQDDDILIDLHQIAARLICSDGVPAERADELAGRIAQEIRSAWGGQQIYIKKTDLAELSARNLDIYNAFNGANHHQLAKKHGLAVPVIYRIIKSVQQQERDKRQHKLFSE
ncbi:Mor transcription activator family protein [Pseudohongiella acticola]|uniref:Mor transcription activator family protein n=1 Tax=Pseudohongiella acticola TaxID=1524254 RepID=UPI0030ED2798